MSPGDDWQKVGHVAGFAGAIGVGMSVFRAVIESCGGFRVWVSGMFASSLVGAAIGLSIHDSGMWLGAQSVVIAVCAYVARDVLTAVKQLSSMLANSPFDFLTRLRALLRGDKEGQ